MNTHVFIACRSGISIAEGIGLIMRWIALDEQEYEKVWNYVYEELGFHPSVEPRFVTMNISRPAFTLPSPYRIYDISTLLDAYEISTDKAFDRKMIDIFETMLLFCVGNEAYIYALDWQHTCYKYYPKASAVNEIDQYPKVSFFPDGDYSFFIAADFSWGYLAHPWQQGIYAYGYNMVEYLKQNEKNLFLTLKYET